MLVKQFDKEDEEKAHNFAIGLNSEQMNMGELMALRQGGEIGFLNGLAEGKPKWHDLRKNPDDLPGSGRQVIVADKSRNGYDFACFCRSGNIGFWSYGRFISNIEDNYVLAWCDFKRLEE